MATFFNAGLPFGDTGAMIVQTDTAPAASDPYVAGVRVGTLGVYLTTAAPPTTFAALAVAHTLVPGLNPGGNRVGYRRNEWGTFLPDDAPALERFFSNLNNNRIVLQGTGDLTAVVIDGLVILRQSDSQLLVLGAPSAPVFDGTHTEWFWVAPGFDFVVGDAYSVRLI